MALDHNPFDARHDSSTSTNTAKTGGSSARLVFLLLAAVLGAAVVAGVLVAVGQWSEGRSTASSTSSTYPTPAPTQQDREPSETFTGAARPDDSTGRSFNGGISGIALPDVMQAEIDPEFFREARLTKYTTSTFEGREYGVEATMTDRALEDPAGLIAAMNALTKDYCFWGFRAEGVQSADTVVNVSNACQVETPTEPFAAVITAMKDHNPHEIRQNRNVENGFDVYFFDSTREELDDLRGVEGANITAFVSKGTSDIVQYEVTTHGLEAK